MLRVLFSQDKGIFRALLTMSIFVFVHPLSAGVVTFSDQGLGSNSYNNGDPGNLDPGQSHDGTFTSGGVSFKNTVDQWSGYSSWSGWAPSTMNDQTTEGYLNQYSVFESGGIIDDRVGTFGGEVAPAGADTPFGVYYASYSSGSNSITFPGLTTVHGMFINNTTYAALSMQNGDGFAKSFGGLTGDDPDWFKLSIVGYDNMQSMIGTVEFFLADFRFADNNLDYIVDEWTWVDLSPLGDSVSSLSFELTSTDNDPTWGINTPTYFAMDNLSFEPVPEPSTVLLLGIGILGMAGFSINQRKKKLSS
ncbi:MAG: DUF4465 domain-containing protein [Pirellulaceae bacterium]|nr:DUF4465 domain-containing protein [Pirellulaceae bacterium]